LTLIVLNCIMRIESVATLIMCPMELGMANGFVGLSGIVS